MKLQWILVSLSDVGDVACQKVALKVKHFFCRLIQFPIHHSFKLYFFRVVGESVCLFKSFYVWHVKVKSHRHVYKQTIT